MAKPGIPQGMRDFPAEILRKRQFILDTIRNVFLLYGFEPLETPAMENLDTLMGKYGEEGDKLIFKVLNNGLADPKNTDKAKAGFEKLLQGKTTSELTERALRYDLTIPFARYVAMNYSQLTFPFKRYQVQPVWRADRPQKGRYREFTQCDADIVGSNALINEIELAGIYHDVFTKLGLTAYELKINNRKILAALANICGGKENLISITVAIDKIDKIGVDKVKAELVQRGISEIHVSTIQKYLEISGNNDEKLAQVKTLFAEDQEGLQGIDELKEVISGTSGINIEFDLTLARGLNYYTGSIFEVKAPPEIKMGSIGGGGRYDDLTGLFGVPSIPGVGISFGIDRIYDVLDELELFPGELHKGPDALFFNMGKEEANFAYPYLKLLRNAGVACEMFHEQAKMDKQFKYADKKHTRYAVIIGANEMEAQEALVKNLKTSLQQKVRLDKLIEFFTQNKN